MKHPVCPADGPAPSTHHPEVLIPAPQRHPDPLRPPRIAPVSPGRASEARPESRRRRGAISPRRARDSCVCRRGETLRRVAWGCPRRRPRVGRRLRFSPFAFRETVSDRVFPLLHSVCNQPGGCPPERTGGNSLTGSRALRQRTRPRSGPASGSTATPIRPIPPPGPRAAAFGTAACLLLSPVSRCPPAGGPRVLAAPELVPPAGLRRRRPPRGRDGGAAA